MECPKCKTKLIDNKCPNCNYENEEIELPSLKEEIIELTDKDENLSDNYYEIETKEESFEIEDKPITSFNDMEINESPSFIEEKEELEKDNKPLLDIESKKSIEVRKNTLLLASLFILLIIILSLICYILLDRKTSEESDNKNFSNIEEYLDLYYKNNNTNNLEETLISVSKNENNYKEIQNIVFNKYKNWLNDYIETTYENKETFKRELDNYKNNLDILYNLDYSYKGIEYKLLSYDNYTELSNSIAIIEKDSKEFYNGVELFNKRSYNDSFLVFKNIKEDNIFINKIKEYKTNLINNVINLLEIDIRRIENDNELDQTSKTKNILIIIEAYDNLYNNFNLKNNQSYIEIQTKYKNN